MLKIKKTLQWIWDWYLISMEPSKYFHYMEAKYGQVWYDHVNRNFERRFGE